MTPGPWVAGGSFPYKGNEGYIFSTASRPEVLVCKTFGDIDENSPPLDEQFENSKAITSAINSTYGKNINPESVPDLLEALKGIVAREEKAYAGRKQSADHFNNNTPGVGIKFDYETAAAMPQWISEAKAALAKAQLH